MDQLGDEELMVTIAEGETGALETLYDRYGGPSYALALAETRDFVNAETITINDADATEPVAATPYPSQIVVRRTTAAIQDVNLTLFNVTHGYPDDVDVLVVGPRGQKALVMSDSGGRFDVDTTTLTFDDEATDDLPDSTQIIQGTFKPTQGTSDPVRGENPVPANFPSPAPSGPYATALSVFDGTEPTGTWRLYVIDDSELSAGEVRNGWSLEITTDTQAPRVTTTAPANGATGVAPATNVRATFAEAMNPLSVRNSFKLYKKGSTTAIAATVTYDEATKRAVLDPSANLQRGVTYRAVVSTGARDLSNNLLDQDRDPSNGNQPKVWSFTVRN